MIRSAGFSHYVSMLHEKQIEKIRKEQVMFMKILPCALVLSLMSLTGCKKDAEIGSVLKELDSFTTELVQKIDSMQGSVEGIDAAQQFLDSKKSDLKKKM